MIMIFALEATLIQLAGAYLRYLPFRQLLPAESRKALWKALFLWSLLGLLTNLYLPQALGLGMSAFKLVFLPGWAPYVLISLRYIHRPAEEHLFVFGMQALWAFMLHSFAAMIIALLWQGVTSEVLPIYLLCYLLLFALFFPWARKLFLTLLKKPVLTNARIRWHIAVLPFAIWIGTLLPIVRVTFLPNWGGRLTRFAIPLFFFFAYSAISHTVQEASRRRQLALANLRRAKQRENLERQTRLLEESSRHISVLRHDLRHSYRLIYTLLEKGDDESLREVQEHIHTQKKKLEKAISAVQENSDCPKSP